MKHVLLALGILALLGLIGCEHDSTPSTSTTEDIQATTAEIPEHIKNLLVNPPIGDDIQPFPPGMTYTAELNAGANTWPGYDVYVITLLWGSLANAVVPTTDTTDWSGSLSINGDALMTVRHVIDFENGEDEILDDVVPSAVYWMSFTCNDFDGISFVMYHNRNAIYIQPPVVSFETEPFAMSWGLETLADFIEFYLINNTSAVAIHSKRIWSAECPRGIMIGQWIKETWSADSGTIQGVWYESTGDPYGSMSGMFWRDDANIGRFEGWLSGYVTCEVIAEFEGTWFYDDPRLCPTCGSGHGFFSGHYQYLNGNTGGYMQGVFGYPLDDMDAALPLAGVWRDACPYDDPAVAAW